uniref:Hemicentin 1 n=1 Tax=Oryzias latipes TaxID=8090 RepID=A0A3P9M5Z2_ORYLA
RNEDIPEGASTLAFVFDVTGSMYDDLVQVIEGASKILETSLSRPKRPLYNFALVPFHDPIGPVTITTDPKKFQYELRELYVQGGGDCPEMSIGAIKIALEISLPGSFIYVFTDARSKDFKLTHEVLQLIQQKQSQVVFVLTGDCDDRTHIGYKVYEEIASTSSGQVFHLDKKQVNEVLKWVEEAVQSSKVHLLSTDHFSQVSNTWQLPFDPSLKEITVALSGPAPDIEILNPLKVVGQKDGLTELLHIPNSAKVVNIKEPQAGMWSTSSEGRHSVRISGLSNIDFRAGFSQKPTLDFKMTSSRPVQIPTHVLMNTTGLSPPARPDRLELLTVTGEVIKTLPIRYYPERLPYSLWNITEFVPPNQAFFLRVTGYDRNGFLFQRVSSVSFSSIIPAPTVLMPATTIGYYLQRGSVVCHVESLIPFTLRFSRDGKRLGEDQLFASWEIDQVTLKDEDYYECIAISTAGTGRAQTFLDVSPPPAITVEGNMTASPGARVLLTCHVVSTVRFNFTWLWGGREARLDPRMNMLRNLSLQVFPVTPEDSGWYSCIATNEGGATAERMFLTVQVSVEPQNQTFMVGDDVRIQCSASGYPSPRLVWTHNDMFIVASSYRMTNDGALIIRNSERKDGGVYRCLASNQAGTDTASSILTYVAPKFAQELSDVASDISSNVTLQCRAEGHPEPQITWRRADGYSLFNRPRLHGSILQKKGDLHIILWVDDEAEYICEAQNQFGRIQTQATITVTGLPPVIAVSPAVINVMDGQQLTLPCVLLAGNPLPERQWLHNYGLVTSDQYVTVRMDGSLHIERVGLGDEGDYICLAENVVGSANHTTAVNIHIPTIQHGPQVFSTIEGTPISLPCRANGVPRPDIAWTKGKKRLNVGGPSFSLDPDGNLLINSPSGNETGEFTCTASNAAGSASRKVQLTVYRPRSSSDGTGDSSQPVKISVIEGEDALLPCDVRSVPPPTISWAKGKQLISPFSPHIQLSSGSMKILETRVSDSGFYVCVASNIAGNLTLSTELPPRIQPGPKVMKVQVGHTVELPCVPIGVPEPTVTWTKDLKEYQASPDGSLVLKTVTLEDDGTYMCTASNTAGRDEARIRVVIQPPVVEVLEPPFNSPLQERVANQRIAFPCPAKLPKPVIRWLRNGQELAGNEPGVSILEDGTLLILASVSPLDNGEYVCTAANDAGSTEKKYQLKVNPPDLRDRDIQGNLSVIVNQPISLMCDVIGSPTPVITWYRDGQVVSGSNIQILDTGKTLKLLKAIKADAGSYSCKAINIAGSTEKDFFLDVMEITLECNVQGSPFPIIQWFKNRLMFLGDSNLEVTNRGQVLRIKSARLGDQALYQCSVSNPAGKQSKDFNLIVYPPSIKGGNLTTEVTALQDTTVKLECEARGVPLPTITWYRKGAAVLSNRQTQYVERGHFLKIPRVQATDAGQYTCKVTSVAGSAEKNYELEVYPPTIVGGDDGLTEKKVIVAKSLILECEVAGHPPPSITWLKDGVPVQDGESVRVFEQGKKVEIVSASSSDSGSYVCVATSIAGDKEVKYDVRVLPPFIDGADDVTGRTVLINSPVELECEATGTPAPVIWFKNGKPLKQGQGLRIVASGRRLVVSRAQVTDTAHFQCVATNEAGNHQRDFNVVVQPPSIRMPGPAERSVILNQTISLECISAGIPPPSITWIKDGRPVDTTKERLKLQSVGRTFTISEARREDSGKYTCLATNAAGEVQQHIRLSVHPPSILFSEETINQTILSGFPIEFECKATGSPLPVSWSKDGRPLTSVTGVSVLKRGQVLKIERAQLLDAGVYKCLAVNLAGAAELLYSLQVFPPTISSRGSTVAVVVNEAVKLECEASGVPLPSLTWLKDGSPVVLSAGRVLSLSSAQISDTGTYTCVAINLGGEQQKEYELKVYPPNIKGEEVNSTVMLGQSVELLCQSDAIPPPTLSWRKDGRPLFRKPGLIVADHGSRLKINSAQVQDSGRYTCEATNVAGKTEKNYNLDVWSPSIRGSGEVSHLTVIEGNLISLVCELSGIPPPSLTWKKDFELKSDQRLRILSGGRQLQISGAQKADTAAYTCLASSAAGATSKEYNLQVYRPSIRRGEGETDDITVIKGGNITLDCAAEGVPKPAVSWLKDGRPITGQHGAKVLNDGRLLQIRDADVTDTGRYTCVSVNVAGQADSKYDVSVHPPSILGQVQSPENISVVVKNPVALSCEASGIPLPTISWLKDDQPIQTSSSVRILSGRSVRLMHAAVEDAGRYTCIVSNSGGEERKNFDLDILVPPRVVAEGTVVDTKVKEKRNITLTCEASNPVPEIKWLKDGLLLVPDRHHQILSHGRFLQISEAQVADTGRYSCLASNSAGDRSRHYNLNVLSPTIAGNSPDFSAEEVIVTLSSPTSMVCEVQSYPPAFITWLKDGIQFESTRNVRVLPGRTLQILNAKVENAGRYTCVATNEAGETLKHYKVKVYPPQINKNDISGHGLSSKEVKVTINSTLTLECVAQAFPSPTLQWYKDGQILRADDHVSITANGRIVQIKHAQVSDTGRYTCVATNVAGEDEKDFDVNIQVILNNPFSLYCETNAVPPPTLTWYKDGRLLTSNDKVLIFPGRVLQIPRARLEDSGRYTCVAINEAGQDSIQYDVRVLPPVIREKDSDVPDEVTVLINQTAQLDCHVDGNPTPKVTWFKDSQLISSEGPYRVLSSGRTLQVVSALVPDTGRYVCVAENVAGSSEKQFNLNVHPPSIFGVSLENVTAVVNNFVSLSCEVTGFPPPTLSWLSDRGPIQASSNILIMPGRTLQILKPKVSDGGKYTCVAMNAAGEAYKHIHLTVFVPPSIRGNSGDAPVVVNALVGKSITLECESNAVPPPNIIWYKNGRVLTESANLQILAEGQILKIKTSEVSDTGQYVCIATNVAGQVDKNFHLNIHPPRIDGSVRESLVEIISNSVSFACDASGIPPPNLSWLKNGQPINSESLEMHISSGGSKLQIARLQLSDGGTYTCVASNVEGKARKSYHLTIQPPSITGSDMPSEMGVLLNESIQMVCQAQGAPVPTIQWLKDGKAVNRTGHRGLLSPDGSRLTVVRAHPDDSGKYTCVATNAAGEEDRIFNLNVYPPVIVGNSGAPEHQTAVLDSSVSIQCVAAGIPLPHLNWLKNGLPLPVSSHVRLLSAGQVLITRIQVSDGGKYTCVASNRAGVDNKHYNLQVHPPGLDGAGSTEDVTVIRGNTASLLCVADGTPVPTISWLREDVPVLSEHNIRLLNLNTTLQISLAQVNDTGHYTCKVYNTAGEASRHFNLKVLPPQITGSGDPVEVSVLVNNVLELECEASGIPTPFLTWLKDGRPLPQTDSLRLLRGGEVLRMASAQDTGRYSCLANSPAGDDDKEFLVQVHPPNIVGENTPQDVSVLQNRQATLECKSDAVPPPTLTWLKDGQQLQSARVRILSGGRYLQINLSELSDTAQYMCVASNVAGKTTREFNLNVNVAPTIKDGPQIVTVHVDKSAVLECVVNGVPPPRVTWRKNGAILGGNNPYTFEENGSLHIHSAQVSDTGRYLCLVTNPAGTQRRRVDMQVYPPSIANSQTNVTVIVNVQTTLPCEASGIPKPTVSWQKKGRTISTDQNQNMYLLSSGSLVILAPTVEDTAVYTCVVSNEAGNNSKSISLTVIPPSIADEPAELVVLRQSPVVIACTAYGVPKPSIHWSKDGMKLPNKGQGYNILPTISSAELSHAGRYSCTAKNIAGSTQRHVPLTVHLPVIQSHPSSLDVIFNTPITLPCKATGSPRPTITWQKEGINIPTTGGFTVLPDGSLQITRTTLSDSGTYICVAQNPAGTAMGKTKLRVQPPVIRSEIQEYLAPVDSAMMLHCHAEGTPPPSVTWHKDGQLLSDSVRQRLLSSGSLQITLIQPTDSGRYTCTAANAAGTASLDMSLTVQPPSIRGGEQEVVVVESSHAQLMCVAEGIPQPSLSWEKDGNPLSERGGEYTILPSGELVIDSAQPGDAGSYTCFATNAVGQDSWTVKLSVHTHPVFVELLGDIALNRGERLLLACGASGIPQPRITWTFNNNIIPHYDQTNGRSELLVERVSKGDTGTYTCVAENNVGTIKSLGFVHVKPPIIDGDLHSNRVEPLGGNTILNCEVRGDPPPTIQWSKNGVNIQIGNRIRQMFNGSLAIYGTVSEDAGIYMCVATNDAGVVERSITLTLQAPTITVEPVGTVVNAGTTVVLSCQAEGEPTPMIEWSRQGRPLQGEDRFSTLFNGSLRISSAQKEDTAEYECVARNLLGSVLVRVTLTVRHGGYSEWSEWGSCSVSCGAGIQKRLRQCNNPLPANGGRHCAGSDTEKSSCQGNPCPDGNWSEWSVWEECSQTCGQGNRTRFRTCSNPLPQYGGKPCEGKAVEVIMCSVRPCPAGNWGSWLPWGPCSETCGRGMQSRIRLCNNPPPQFDGSQCEGTDTQSKMCLERLCPHGKWSSWMNWGPCSVSCGGGTRQRTRLCASPAPQHGGRSCEGNGVHVDFCNTDPCPVSGNWGTWSSWGSCSKTCNGGQMRRYRTCDSPRPAFGGRACAGADEQMQRCSIVSCPDGNWGSWQPWGQCSVSCGGGERTRLRLCNNPAPSYGGRQCPGDSSLLTRCNTQACPGPQKARGSIRGNINDIELGIAILNATISDSSSGSRVIKASISNVPRELPAMRKLVSLLNAVYWTTAHEAGEAVNGYTLTGGVFKRETQVEFATEILRMTHIARGLDSDGVLLIDIVVNGHTLLLPSQADIHFKDYTEDYIQTGPGQLYALSTRIFSINNESVPYSWNHTIFYDPSKGKMPYLVEMLHATSISALYHPLEEMLEYSIQAKITKDRSNQCPNGFILVSSGLYCAENECDVGNPCSHTCNNVMGTYYCSCPQGLSISADGKTCQIDECSLSGHVCHDGQDCENTVGSYRCLMRCGRGFRRTTDDLNCIVNECQESNPCNQRCFNTIGGYRCACEPGFQLRNRRCIINECRQRVCRLDQLCKNTRGSYTCIDLCPSGMTKGANGTVDECREGTHQCSYNQICENTRGSYHCSCPRGYRSQGLGRPCIINECERLPQPCAHQCINTPGSYTCICPPGRHLLGDGKSCAGLERLPSYESYSHIYRSSQSSPEGSSSPRLYHNLASQSFHSFTTNTVRGFRRRSRREASKLQVTLVCQRGFESRGGLCLINECEMRDTCQHECMNTPGSHRCLCPAGYRLMINGKTCQVDECLEQNIQCGMNRMCFNMRGSYECIDTPCPPNYQRDPATFCLKNCPPNDLECTLSHYALEYKLLSLPFGIASNQDLIRLVAYTQDGVMHTRTTFSVVDQDLTLPFALRDENHKGVLFTTRPLREPHTYRMKVRALSFSEDGGIEYRTTFIVYIAVSAYPY